MAIVKNVWPDVLDHGRERVRVRLARARACAHACRDISHKCAICVRCLTLFAFALNVVFLFYTLINEKNYSVYPRECWSFAVFLPSCLYHCLSSLYCEDFQAPD